MQVTNVKDHVTHAVIGGKKAIDFGISSSAEFFNILSSTLYSDQHLAVIRETICNAWDSHIESGCTDKPIRVSITTDKLIIEDFGKGIHEDDFPIIYGVYGNSTKKSDGKQTGGFGLGCKAPFAYTDHFQVTSSHNGIKTIYSLSKSSAEVMGKPGIIPIASFPTTDQGICVEIQIKSQEDFRKFSKLIKRIIKNGGINAEINGNKAETYDYASYQDGFMIICNDSPNESQSSIYIKYGNVIYPLDTMDRIKDEYIKANKALNNLSGTKSYGYNNSVSPLKSLVLFADPNTISVTPSREALSMQEHTIVTALNLLTKFNRDYTNSVKNSFMKYCKEFVDKAVAEKRIKDLINGDGKLPTPIESSNKLLTSLDQVCELYHSVNYPDSQRINNHDLSYRLEVMIANKMIDRGKGELVRQEVNVGNKGKPVFSDVFSKRIIGGLAKKLLNADGLDVDRMFVFNESRAYSWEKPNNSGFIKLKEYYSKSMSEKFELLRNVVIITRSKGNMLSKLRYRDSLKDFGRANNNFVYWVSGKSGAIEAALTFFTGLGMNVIDLTKETLEEKLEKQVTSAMPKERKPRIKGIPKLSYALVSSTTTGFDLKRCSSLDTTRIEDPKCIFKISYAETANSYELLSMPTKMSKKFIDLFGDECGVVNNLSQEKRYLIKGALSGQEYILKLFYLYLKDSPEVAVHISHSISKVSDLLGINATNWVERLITTKVIRDQYSLNTNLDEKTQFVLDMFIHVNDLYNWRRLDKIRDLVNQFQLIPPCKGLLTLVTDVTKSRNLQLLDKEVVLNQLELVTNSPARITEIEEILMNALKG